MSNKVIVGTQWGDEGKGKIVDLLSQDFDVIVRYQGGANAGHTVYVGNEKYIFHLLPSGVLHKGKTCVLANGIVADPDVLIEEIEGLEKRRITIDDLAISDRAQVTLEKHLKEDAAKGGKIGTTKRGIGPTYRDKIDRQGFRFGDILSDKKVREFKIPKTKINYWRTNLAQYIKDTSLLLNKLQKQGKRILFEGAQGTHLDVDFGTYPFVTSSNTVAGGAGLAGLGPRVIDDIVGIVKSYDTRVGEGPFPTELGKYHQTKKEKQPSEKNVSSLLKKINDNQANERETGKYLRAIGGEYGATTGRPRRVGWLDLVQLKYSIRVNGITELALTKLDVLDQLERIKVCTAYKMKEDHKMNGSLVKEFPLDTENVEPLYTQLKGWKESTESMRTYKKLPIAVKHYLHFIETFTETPIKIISKGKERNQTIIR
ncbi:adenylosuccinate synthetase [Nanoarchaeota archaeon]